MPNAGEAEAGIAGIVFDAVGTLIEPAPPVADVYCDAARRQGIDLERSTIKARFHHHFQIDESTEASGPLRTDEPNELRRWQRIVANVLHELPDPDRAFNELWDHFGRSTGWRCYDDVAPALLALADRGLPMFIGSNFDVRLRGVVSGLDAICNLRENLLISSEVGHRKPHPAFYAAVAAKIRLPAARILFVGDDLENDVLAPGRAGFRSILLNRRGQSPEGTPCVPDLLALVEFVRRSRSPRRNG